MVHIVTDTTAVLPQDIADRYGIPIVPQVIHFGRDSFLECQEMDSQMFMERLLTSKTLWKSWALTFRRCAAVAMGRQQSLRLFLPSIGRS